MSSEQCCHCSVELCPAVLPAEISALVSVRRRSCGIEAGAQTVRVSAPALPAGVTWLSGLLPQAEGTNISARCPLVVLPAEAASEANALLGSLSTASNRGNCQASSSSIPYAVAGKCLLCDLVTLFTHAATTSTAPSATATAGSQQLLHAAQRMSDVLHERATSTSTLRAALLACLPSKSCHMLQACLTAADAQPSTTQQPSIDLQASTTSQASICLQAGKSPQPSGRLQGHSAARHLLPPQHVYISPWSAGRHTPQPQLNANQGGAPFNASYNLGSSGDATMRRVSPQYHQPVHAVQAVRLCSHTQTQVQQHPAARAQIATSQGHSWQQQLSDSLFGFQAAEDEEAFERFWQHQQVRMDRAGLVILCLFTLFLTALELFRSAQLSSLVAVILLGAPQITANIVLWLVPVLSAHHRDRVVLSARYISGFTFTMLRMWRSCVTLPHHTARIFRPLAIRLLAYGVVNPSVRPVLLKCSLTVGAWELLAMSTMLLDQPLCNMLLGQACTWVLSLVTAALLDARARWHFRQLPHTSWPVEALQAADKPSLAWCLRCTLLGFVRVSWEKAYRAQGGLLPPRIKQLCVATVYMGMFMCLTLMVWCNMTLPVSSHALSHAQSGLMVSPGTNQQSPDQARLGMRAQQQFQHQHVQARQQQQMAAGGMSLLPLGTQALLVLLGAACGRAVLAVRAVCVAAEESAGALRAAGSDTGTSQVALPSIIRAAATMLDSTLLFGEACVLFALCRLTEVHSSISNSSSSISRFSNTLSGSSDMVAQAGAFGSTPAVSLSACLLSACTVALHPGKHLATRLLLACMHAAQMAVAGLLQPVWAVAVLLVLGGHACIEAQDRRDYLVDAIALERAQKED